MISRCGKRERAVCFERSSIINGRAPKEAVTHREIQSPLSCVHSPNICEVFWPRLPLVRSALLDFFRLINIIMDALAERWVDFWADGWVDVGLGSVGPGLA